MTVRYVNTWETLPLWQSIEPLIQKALRRGNGEWEAEDFLTLLLAGEMHLFVSSGVRAVSVAQIVTYPRKKICDVILVGGDGLKDWAGTKVIETWAKTQGCHLMRCYGRRGWARAVGWTEKQSIAIKEL